MNSSNPVLKILPPTGLLITVLLSVGAHFLLSGLQIVPGFWRLLGIIPLILGLIISYIAEKQFHQVGTTVKPFKESNQLVVDGLYHYSRHPMYLGMVLILLGVALLLGSLPPFLVAAFFIGWLEIQFIRREEAMLFTQFGQDWLEYKAHVRRWF
jgi:protein-S-isoprenylcysteine O-methyltransferase Ste14